MKLLLASFTFHYVSIKSWRDRMRCRPLTNLHSTMYLLNLEGDSLKFSWTVFTFHYVSIKSQNSCHSMILIISFTFHYVSIKS